jgi:hypothetical protein
MSSIDFALSLARPDSRCATAVSLMIRSASLIEAAEVSSPLFPTNSLPEGGILEKTMETNHYKTTAYAIRIGDEWFAGFGGKPGQESLTKVRPGLCDAKLVWDDRKAAAYVERLRVRGYAGEIVKVTA